MKKVLVVFNPVSGKKVARDLPALIKRELKSLGYEWTWFNTVKADRQPLEQFLDEKFHRVVVVGGDGTVAEVASFINRNSLKTPLLIIPQGSGNLLARALFLPLLSVKKALRFGLKTKAIEFDTLFVNGKYYGLLGAGIGYDTFVMKETSRSARRRFGIFAYIFVAIKNLLIYRAKPYRVTVDGERHYVLAKSIVVFNMLPLLDWKVTNLLADRVLPNDGKLNVYVLDSKMRLKSYCGKEVVIKSKKARRFEIDGDVFKGTTMSVKVLPKAIKIVSAKTFKK
ncbi:hypothetical protein HOK22_05175 [Candidatus Peregrinibacteria bacterium]|nr:hypothetical protein [Candidatus Peregrinibacteria bacterium]